MASDSPTTHFSSGSFANATATLTMFGATSSLFGPLLVTFSRRFHLGLPDAGVILSVFFVGALVGVPLGYVSQRRAAGESSLRLLMWGNALGACGAWLARDWAALLASVFVIGVMFGAVDFALNTLLVRADDAHRGHRLSVVNAGYGVGSVLGPVALIVVHPSNFGWVFAALTVVSLALSFGFRGVRTTALRTEMHPRTLLRAGPRRQVLSTFVVAYVLYVCLETATSGWIAPHLHRVGYSQTLASAVTAGFWGALALGRSFGGALSKKWAVHHVVMVSLFVAVALALSAVSTTLAPYAYPILGLGLASIYPLGLIWYASLAPDDHDGLAALILLMMIGGILGPAAVSVAVAHFGIRVVPVVIAVFAGADLVAFNRARGLQPARSPSAS